MQYIIEDTPNGWRLSIPGQRVPSGSLRYSYYEVNSNNGPICKAWENIDVLWDQLRTQETAHKGPFIIEHPTRGTLREVDYEWGTPPIAVPRFSWSGARNDPEKAIQFPALDDAKKVYEKLSPKLQRECKILRAPQVKGDGYIKVKVN